MLPLLHFCKRWEPAFYELFVSWWDLNGVTGVNGWKRTHSGIDLWELIEKAQESGLVAAVFLYLMLLVVFFLLFLFSLVLFDLTTVPVLWIRTAFYGLARWQ